MTAHDEEIAFLRARPEHEAEILDLLAAALAWEEGPSGQELHRWKHRENPFGASAEWVAVAGGRVVGYRAFQRWELDRGGTRIPVARAVDAATRPEYRGRGVFTNLTLRALDALRADGIEFVFSTPNSQSRPGHLKMGWQVVGRLPVSARVRSLPRLARMITTRGDDRATSRSVEAMRAPQALAETTSVRELLSRLPKDSRLHTPRSVEYLQWRYRPDSLGYHAVTAGDGVSDGLAVFRTRHRGSMVAASICELLVPAATPDATGTLLRAVRKTRGIDDVLRLSGTDVRRGFIRLPGRGPVLTWRGVRAVDMPDVRRWNLEFGDVELF